MPFCTQCGKPVGPNDVYCASCGGRQAAPEHPGTGQAARDPLAGLTPRTACLLCYIPTIGWIGSVVVLASRKFKGDHIVRFHAFQGLYLFACWMLVNWVVKPFEDVVSGHMVRTSQILELILVGVSIFMIVRTLHGEDYSLPVLGELAKRSATEQ